ncbi:hypothetical protein CAPTEDRAFT_21087 [Capitella teleta]|uniref:Akirin n=1 Tax=Capitella teleta TaxID=283909 RepID=R7U969_CAPTE|nr:hypothetical protein CAPTEDRAFT_21087 [Capitella teleta]|eukprot:ELU00237.1 hypothetical protein CAPTEDRAFT_21087 [Capitella teleta]
MACGATLSLKRSLEFDPLYSPSHKSPKRRRCMPMTLSPSTPPTKQANPSPFAEVTPKLTSEQIAQHLSCELRRMHRRRQLHLSGSASPPHPGSVSPSHPSATSSSMGGECSTSSGTMSPSGKKDVPLLSLRQVGMVCERLLKEQEEHIREEYDKVLTNKLAEQYEAFLKFNHDQLHRRFQESAASYVS